MQFVRHAVVSAKAKKFHPVEIGLNSDDLIKSIFLTLKASTDLMILKSNVIYAHYSNFFLV